MPQHACAQVEITELQQVTHYNLYIFLVTDWRALAEKVGLDALDIDGIKEFSSNPTEVVIYRAIYKQHTVGQFLEHLYDLERFDVINVCKQMLGKQTNRILLTLNAVTTL